MASDAVAVLDYTPIRLDFSKLSLEEQCEAIWAETIKQERAEERIRRRPPVVLVWDGEWRLQHVIATEYKAQFSWISNDSGPGQTTLPFDCPAAQWIHDMEGRINRGDKRNVHVTVDHCGARWGGRLDQSHVKLEEDGDKALEVTWLHDYENLKWYTVRSNPFLPEWFQFPRAMILAGPVPWLLKAALWMQLFRENGPTWRFPDDPLSLDSWGQSVNNVFSQAQWHIVCQPGDFFTCVNNGEIWGVVSSRWSNFHDMARPMLEDGEYSVDARRWITGDPPPWPGAQLRSGALVVDVINKSGFLLGTSHGGTVFDGLMLTASEFGEAFIDTVTAGYLNQSDLAPTVKENYEIPGVFKTQRELPYAIYREGDQSAIQTAEFVVSPCKGFAVSTGGHSMPGVNEAISASIQALGGLLGSLFMMGSLGGTIDTLLKPLYEDVLLAFQHTWSAERAANSGWDRYHEYWQDGAGKAYTIASLMVLRAGFWATKTVISCKVSVLDGAPFRVGDRGLGHHWLDDRIGVVLKDDITGRIYMDRCRKIDLSWDETSPAEWLLTIGDDRMLQDPAQRAWGKIESMVGALRELGMY